MYEAYIVGLFPREDGLVIEWKRYEQDPGHEPAFRNALSSSLDKVVRLQLDAGLSYVHDPLIDWHDLFRPFTHLDGVELGPITRYYETNTFYKKPIFRDEPTYPKGFIERFVHAERLPSNHVRISTLPGPYTFCRLAEFGGGVDPVDVVSKVLSGAIGDLLGLGYGFVNLAEPELVYKEPDDSLVKECYGRLRAFKDAIRLQLFFGDASRVLDLLESLPIYGYSIDAQFTDVSLLDCPKKHLTLGVIDGQNTLMEDLDLLKAKIADFVEGRPYSSLGLSNNVDLDFLPYEVAVEKVKLLGELYRRVAG